MAGNLPGKASRVLAAGALALVLGWACRADAQVIKVGSFTKSTAIAPPNRVQVVPHGLGVTPKALVLWTDRYAGGFLYAFGITDGTTSRSVAMASQNAVNPSNSSRRIAAKALTIVRWGEALVAEADLTSWDGNNFTLTWTTNDATADTIHFIAIGGSGVSAKVVDWLMPAAPGTVSVATVGFSPDVVLHAHAGFTLSGALPLNATYAAFGLGAMDRAGGQWATEVTSVDNVTPSNTGRGQVTNACIYAFDDTLTVQKSASFASMDANGFTVNFGTVATAVQSRAVSLALKGVSATASSFLKSVAPAFVAGQTAYLNAPAGSTASLTLPAASTNGDLIVVSFDVPSQALGVLSVSDSKGNTYSPAIAPTNWNGVADRMYTYYASGITGGGAAITITITLSGATGANWESYAVEYSGVARYNPVDQTSSGTGNGTAWSSGAKTTTSADQLVYGFCMSAGSGTPNVPLVQRDVSGSGNFVADRTVTATGSFSVTGTGTAAQWGCQMATFRGGQSLTGMYFTPGAVLLASPVTGAAGAQSQARLGLGAADSALHQGASAITDQNNVAATNNWGTDATWSAFIKSDNATGTIDAQAVAASFENDGFTLDWTTNDAVANTRILYLALGSLGPVGVGCSAGTYPTGTNFVKHGIFDGGTTPAANNFTTGATWDGMDACPGDTGITIRTVTGLCGGNNDSLTQFPGDASAGVPATTNSLYTNGNNMWPPGPPYAPNLYWRQTVTGLTQNTTYTFFLYASNANNGPVAAPPVLPSLRFCKGVTGTGPFGCTTTLNAVDFTIANETPTSGDIWRRYQVVFTTGAGETSVDLGVLDTATDTNGDDVQITQIGVKACTPTAVALMSFDAAPSDGAVDVAWATGSEVDNLGFNLYRGPSALGPWIPLNIALIPGQGFSAMGASYAWRDSGLQNGTRYFYRLEDVDAKSESTFHGPVSASPQAGIGPGSPTPPDGGGSGGGGSGSGGSGGTGTGGSGAGGPGEGGSPSPLACPAWALAQLGGSSSSYTCETLGGDPASSTFRVLSRTSVSLLVELRTPGFLAARDLSGRVRSLVPGFETLGDPLAPALPLKRAVLDAVVGRKARLRTVEAAEVQGFRDLLPAAVGRPEAVVSSDGTVRPGRREVDRPLFRGILPRELARLAGEGFMGEEKTLTLELTPLRFDASDGSLLLARRLLVRIDFDAAGAPESGSGRLGRLVPRQRPDTSTYAFLATSATGLHGVPFESVFPGRSRPVETASLRLSRDRGQVSVPFHVEPPSPFFGPGSRLFFLADSVPPSTAFSSETVYALERGEGAQMALPPAVLERSVPVLSRGQAQWEVNRIYCPDILDAEDLWQWAFVLNGSSTTQPFSLPGLDPTSRETAHLVVHLQGGSDAPSVVDNHVQLSVNGALLADESFDGAVPHRIEVDLPVSALRTDTSNDLTLVNVGDTGVYSRVFLDRFEIVYPQTSLARDGLFDGVFSRPGTAEPTGLASPIAVVDATSSSWLAGAGGPSPLRFPVRAAHRYLAVSQEALLAPRVFFPTPARLRDTVNQADYILIAPEAFMAAAQPLLERRRDQGLSTFAASLEEIASSFGGGQASAEAIHDFLSFAFHSWPRPSPRYVLLLGDSNYDPRHFLASSPPSPLPFLLQRTSFLWTASDPSLAAVNGDDLLPDLAIGRLPAATADQAQSLVAKLLDWEAQGQSLAGPAALVADQADDAGDFEADLRDIESSFLQGRPTTEVFLGQIGDPSSARAQILDSFDSGLGLISYAGHGGGAVWSSQNILNSWDAASLLAQPRQPFMITLDCLNGYFIAPTYESLAEAFLKAQGRGSIAAFSPTGLSLDTPAHVFHRALVQEITSGSHPRLGDAILAAQKTYAHSGAFPELLSVYHLFGDPGLRISP